MLHETYPPLPVLGLAWAGSPVWNAPEGAIRGAASAGAGGANIAEAALMQETLPNGTRVLVMRDTAARVVAMRAVWRGGLRLETSVDNGISMLLASLVTQGCGDHDAISLAHQVDNLSGHLSGVTGRNTFGVRAEWPIEHWQAGLSLLADCIIEPRFEDHQLSLVKRQLLDIIAAQSSSPRFEAFRIFAEALYPGHAYGMDIMGTVSTVTGLARQQVSSFYRRHFPVEALTLVIVGDVEPARVMVQVRHSFGRALPDGQLRRGTTSLGSHGSELEQPGEVESSDAVQQRRLREVYRYLGGSEAHLVIGFSGTTLDNPDRHALQVLAAVLGGPKGRLREELQMHRALAHWVEVVSIEGVEPGYLAVNLACRPEALAAVFRSVRVELARIRGELVTPEELLQAKSHLIDIHTAASQQPSAVAAALALHHVLGLGHERFFAYEDEIQAVDADALRRAAAEYMAWDAAVVVTVKPSDVSPDAARRVEGGMRRMLRGRRANRKGDVRARGR